MQLLQTELSDSKQKVDQLESQLIKLQDDDKRIEAQLQHVQVRRLSLRKHNLMIIITNQVYTTIITRM